MKTTNLRIQPPRTMPKKSGTYSASPYQRLAIRMLPPVMPRNTAATSTPTSALHSPGAPPTR